MKYIVDLPEAYTSKSALFGDILSIPICLESGKRYGIPTGIKLEPYTEPDREAIEDEVWEFAKTVSIMKPEDKRECWGIDKYNTINLGYSYQEAKEKYEVWRKQKDEINVGDEVTDNDLGDIGVVTYVNDSCCCVLWSSGVVSEEVRRSELSCTGKHFNITHELLKKMKEHRGKDGN